MITAKRVNEHWEADLIDMQKLSSTNNGTRYLLTIIDVYSKFLRVIPLLNKEARTVRKVFVPLLLKIRPRVLQTDNGQEFKGLIDENNQDTVQIFTPPYTPQKNGQIERVNGTIKRMIFQYMTNRSSRRYIDALPSLVQNYNESVHSTSKLTPKQIVENRARYTMKQVKPRLNYRVMKPGDKVRISELLNPVWKKNLFVKKHYLPRWTKKLYTIKSKSPGDKKPVSYTLVETGLKRYQGQDLQYVNTNELVRVTKTVFDTVSYDTETPNIPVDKIPVTQQVGKKNPLRQRRLPIRFRT